MLTVPETVLCAMVLRMPDMLCGRNVDFPQQLMGGHGERPSSLTEVFGQLQALALVIGTQAFPITLRGRIS